MVKNKKKKIIIIIGVWIILQLFISNISSAVKYNNYFDDENTEGSISNDSDLNYQTNENIVDISDAWIEWNKLSDEEKAATIEPRKEKISIESLDEGTSSNKEIQRMFLSLKSNILPTSYNLSDEINIKVEDQGQTRYLLCFCRIKRD